MTRHNLLRTTSIRSGWKSVAVGLALATVLGCSGDPRALEEAVEANAIGLTRLVINTNLTTTNQIFINPGERLQFGFEAFRGDTEISVSNADRRWSVSDASVASISRTGLLSGEANGTVDVVMRIGGIISDPLTVIVSDAELTSIASISGDDSLIECAISGDYTALGLFSDDSERELRNIDWSVIDGDSGVLLRNLPASAVVGSLLPGTIVLQATVGEIEGTRDIMVIPGLDSLDIVPEAITIERAASQALVARANYADSTTSPVSELVTWSLAPGSSIATLAQASGETGVLTGVSLGMTTVMANCGDGEQVADVTVIEPEVIASVEIEASDDPLVLSVNGSSEQLRLFATSTGGSFEEVTNSASWSVSAGDENVVDLDDAGSSRGEITPRNVGRVTITASYRGIEDTLSVIVQ